MKKFVISLVVIVAIVTLFGWYRGWFSGTETEYRPAEETTESSGDSLTTDEDGPEPDQTTVVLGQSVEGRAIEAVSYGTGDTELLIIGGIHGGYEWNTVLLAYEMMDWFDQNPDVVPEDMKVTVVPVLNPDGLEEVVGTAGLFSRADVPVNQADTIPGRFNANDIDLNRNFDCDWQTTGTWQDRDVDGGTAAFSEPESQALRDYVNENRPEAAVVLYSAANGVFASNCHNGPSDETLALVNTYADASGYPAFRSYDFYEITGDAANWLAKQNTPTISILLETHDDIEWEKNKRGVEALLGYLTEAN